MAAEKDKVVDEFTRPTVKLIVGLIFLIIARFVLTRLPGLGMAVPDQPITFSTVVGAAITLFIVAIIANFGRELEPRINRTLAAPPNLTADLASAAKYLTFFVAIVFAYDGLHNLIIPYLLPDPGPGVYDILFLLLAAVPALLFIQRLYANLDEVTELITTRVKENTVSVVDCPECEEEVRGSKDFCPNCGNDISELTAASKAQAKAEPCPDCGARIEPDTTFCGNCGTAVNDSSDKDDGFTTSEGTETGADD